VGTRIREYKSEFARRYFNDGEAKGKAEGKAEDVLDVLAVRGIEVPDLARARISGCTDLAQLESWVRRAAVAGSVDELFRSMTVERVWKTDTARRNFEAAKAKSMAKAVLTVLSVRGIDTSEQDCARIRECTDLVLLYAWVRRAAVAYSVDEIFA
jgi:hypothetical protein